MRALPTYSRTKPTAIPWIGEVPAHWEVVRLRHVIREPLKYGANESAELDDPTLPRYIRITDFGANGLLRDETFKSLPREKAEEYLLTEGDILFARSGATVGKTFQFKGYGGDACFAGYLIKASVDPQKITSDFLYLYTRSAAYEVWKDSIFNQATIQNIGADKYQDLKVILPPLPEQTHIARYLTYKTVLIDAYLARKRRMMALLKEQRQALISQAVTKGLDPNAPMKDSGVEWVGAVPEHWEVKRIKHLGIIDNSGCWGADEGDEAGLRPVSTTAHLTMDGQWLKDEMPYRWFTGEEIERYEGKVGDIIIVKSSGSAANIISGKAGIITENEAGLIFSNFLMRIRPTAVEALFLYYFLTSHLTRERIEMMVSATTYPNLKVDEYFNHLIPVPGRNEQQAIVAFITDKVSQITDELTRIETSMERVREYRQALISAVVTGKMDVRGVELPEEDQIIGGSNDQMMEEEAGMSAVDVLDEGV